MKVLGNYVLVKQTMTKKVSQVILPESVKDNKDNFIVELEIVQFGNEAEKKAKESGIKVGDTPVFAQHVQFQGVKLIEKNDKKAISLTIVHIEEIIAVDNEAKQEISAPKPKMKVVK